MHLKVGVLPLPYASAMANSQHGLGWFHHLSGDCSKSELDRQSDKPPLGK